MMKKVNAQPQPLAVYVLDYNGELAWIVRHWSPRTRARCHRCTTCDTWRHRRNGKLVESCDVFVPLADVPLNVPIPNFGEEDPSSPTPPADRMGAW
jgi:hypothetical protein